MSNRVRRHAVGRIRVLLCNRRLGLCNILPYLLPRRCILNHDWVVLLIWTEAVAILQGQRPLVLAAALDLQFRLGVNGGYTSTCARGATVETLPLYR